MPKQEHILAIETSSPIASVSLADEDSIIQTITLNEQKRHAVELIPTIQSLFQNHNLSPADLTQIYISHGPGSFTGLRIGIATAKTLAHTLKAKLLPVPTLEVVARNASTEHPHVAVCLNAKRGQCFSAIYACQNNTWVPTLTPSLLSPAELLEAHHSANTQTTPLAILGDHLPDHPWPDHITILPPDLAIPHSATVYQLGCALAAKNKFIPPLKLTPHYIRLPEAEEIWQAKHAAK